MGCAAIAFELLCIFRLKIIAQLPHSSKITSPLPRNWNPFCRISVSWPHAADAAPGTRREKLQKKKSVPQLKLFSVSIMTIYLMTLLCAFRHKNAPIRDFTDFLDFHSQPPGVAQSSFLFLRLHFSDFFFRRGPHYY
jgi:hypothetical protein